MFNQESLNFKINIEPRKLNEHIAPDAELTTESSDPSDVSSIYQKYDRYNNQGVTVMEPAQVNDQSSLNVFDSSSSEYDLRQAVHPVVCIITLTLKLLAGFCYLCLTLVMDDLILIYILVILLVCFDFWMTKNISGRLLVGLKWNNTFLADGTEIWNYESHVCAEASNKVDKAFFWTSLILSVTFWIFMLIASILTLKVFWVISFLYMIQMSLTIVALILNVTNFVGFYKCRGEHQKKMTEFQQELTKKGMNVVGMVMLNSKFRV